MKKKYNTHLSLALLCLFLMTNNVCLANTETPDPEQIQHISPYDSKQADATIITLYKTLPGLKKLNKIDRIESVSSYFKGQPYLLGALGEGPKSNYDQNPLYRTDAFDCVTYVNTVLALAFGKDLQGFKKNMLALNYRYGIPAFSDRNHFTSVDWNKNNAIKGYVNDVTYRIVDDSGKPVAAIADTTIDKPNWFKMLKPSQIKRLDNPSSLEAKHLLDKLHKEADRTQQEKSVVLYLPLNRLFNAKGEGNTFIFNQIPNGSIIEIVRPNWPIKKLIGTNMNISHLGFAIRTPQGLMYREASGTEKKIIDIPLTEYLSHYLKSSTVKGINIQEVLEKSQRS